MKMVQLKLHTNPQESPKDVGRGKRKMQWEVYKTESRGERSTCRWSVNRQRGIEISMDLSSWQRKKGKNLALDRATRRVGSGVESLDRVLEVEPVGDQGLQVDKTVGDETDGLGVGVAVSVSEIDSSGS
jgi:hypothetical protein